MKKLYFLAFLFLCTFLTIGTNTAWGETKTITLTHTSFGLTNKYAVKGATIDGVGFKVNQGYKGTAGGGCIQMNSSKGDGVLYNTTPISGLKSVTVNVASGTKTYTITTGTASQPTIEAGTGTTTSTINVKNSGDSYFQLTVSGASYFSSIIITYETGGSTPTYTVTYDANGGVVSPASDSYTNTPINLPTPTIEGCYLFDGWYTAKTGGTKVQSPYTPTANITLYAQWTASTATYMAMINQPDATTNCRVKISKDGTTGVEGYYDDIACGTTIHLLGTPSNGYKGLTYTAKDDKNNNVTITPNGLNNASFVMPVSSVEITATPIPCDAMDAPVVTYTSASNALTFSWKPITGATNYNLYLFYNADRSSHSNDATANTTECSFTFSNLEVGHTYAYTIQAQSAINTCCTETNGTATVVKPYTIIWSTPEGKSTTQVTPGDKVVLPTTDPASCSSTYTNFVGWFTEAAGSESNPSTAKPATQVTAATIPTGDATYYAVFSDGTGDGTLEKATSISNGDVIYLATSPTGEGVTGANTNNKDATVSSTVSEWMPFTINIVTNGFTLTNNGNGVTGAKGSFQLTNQPTTLTFNAKGYFTFKVSSTTYCLLRNSNNGLFYRCYAVSNINNSSYTQFFMYKQVSSATGYISSCCNDPAVVTVTPATTTINLGEDGKATTTVTCTQQNGGTAGTWSYSVSPSTDTFDGTNFVATAAGEYTLTATYTENCGKSGTATITVTNTPVLYFPTIPTDPIKFGTVECGGNTPLENKQSISLRGYNLTGDVTVTVTGDYKIAGTASAALEDYATSLTLPKDAVSGSSASVYVISTPPMQSSSPTQGKVTFTTDGGNTLEVNLSTPDITCTEYTLTLNDRGTTTPAGNYLAGASVPKPAAPTGVCNEPINYIFDGWATAEVANGSTTYTPISFPYTMPKANTTLYAVYRYTDNETNDFELVKDVVTGRDYIIAADYNDKVYALTNSVDENNKGVSTEVTCTGSNETGYIITTSDENIIWHIEGNGTDGFTLYNAAIDKYLNMSLIKTNYSGLLLSQTEDTKYSFTLVDASQSSEVTIMGKNFSSTYNKLSFYQNVFQCYNKKSDNPIYIYGRAYSYTTSPVCGPYIKATGDIAITSGKGIWVESVTPLTISAKNLDKNDDNAAVTITATVTDDAAAQGFSIKTPGTQGAGSKSIVTLVSKYTKATLDTALVVVYTPTDHDQVAEGKIALRVYKSGASATYATDTIVVRGRSLPTEFVLAAKTTNGWVALPSDLAVSSTGKLKYPYAISVDNDATPTKATEAPETALWSADARSAANKLATALRLKNANNQHLQGSKSNKETNVWLSNQHSDSTQSWELRGADFTHYFVRMHASETGRYLSYNATQGKIGNYKQEASLHILPVEKTCVRFDAPKLDVHTLASTYATLLWEAIAGVAEYEYSLDNGATWQTCTDVQTMGTAIQWTFSGLNTETEYIVWVRAKVADGESNCSDYDSKTFTTTFCDDVPTDLWSSATANSVTIMWNAKAATATVKIYSDDKGENEVQSVPNLSSPAKIGGLTPNTKYYFQVLADGSCASAIDNFLTESNEVSIAEWEKEAVIVDINTDVSDADDVSILVENQTTHGSNNKNIADDLFFSKYYEASGELKLVAIYNGTRDTLPLTNIQLKVGTSKWNTTIQMNQYGKFKAGHIAPDEEIIIWHKSKNTSTNKCVASTMDVRIMDGNTSLSFGGRASIGLFRSGDLIDIIGAGTIATSIEGTCKPSWGDANGWCGSGYNIEKNTEEIELSTNRCLLVRSNKVKSGANAVANNTSTFATFTKEEWLGRQVPDDDDTEETVSCEGFAYVVDFNYNYYYTTYDSITKLEIKGNRNADGTYTIPVPRMDTMACTNMRLQLKKAGVVIASREYKVPIVVDKSIDTKNATYFGGNKLTDEVCATCDVVVRDKARLEHVSGGKKQFREMYVYAGSTFTIPEGQTMTLDKVRMFAQNDTTSYAIINNSNATDAAISVKEVSHIKRIDGRYWYPFSLPYDCNIADIDQLSGQTLGVYGEDWGIKFYDGKRRQSDGNSTTHYGEVSKYWTMMPEDGVLKAYTGYIIGLFYPDENLMRSVNFPPANLSAYTEDADSKSTTITNWPYNLTAQPRHHGWNFVGSPYISLFGAATGEGLYNDQLKMGWTDAYGEQQDKEHIYVSIPDGGNSNTYMQALASGVTIKPFTAYFVQAIDPTNNQSNTLSLTYSKANRHLLASPARAAADASPLILAELDIRCGALHDNTGVLVSNVYSAEYEIGDDLTKMYAAAQKPQLYTIDAHNDKMAYQALPDVLAHAIPLGIYVPQAGNYTLSLNRYVSRLEAAEAVYLLHNGAVVANLLLSDYTVSASAKGTISGYSLDIRRAPEVVTDIVPAAGDAPYIIARDGVLAIANLPADAVVQVYDVLGHRLFQTDTHAAGTLQVPVPQTGVYTVVITTADGQQVLKTLLR